MEIACIEEHPFYFSVQFHPEYLSRPLSPSPPFLGLVLASVGKLKPYLSKGCRFSPKTMSDVSSGKRTDLHCSLTASFFLNQCVGRNVPLSFSFIVPQQSKQQTFLLCLVMKYNAMECDTLSASH